MPSINERLNPLLSINGNNRLVGCDGGNGNVIKFVDGDFTLPPKFVAVTTTA